MIGLKKVILISEEHTDCNSVLFAGQLALENKIPLFIEGGPVKNRSSVGFSKIERFKGINSSNTKEYLEIQEKDLDTILAFLASEKTLNLQDGSLDLKKNFTQYLYKLNDINVLQDLYQKIKCHMNEGGLKENEQLLSTMNEAEKINFYQHLLQAHISFLTCDDRSRLMCDNICKSGYDNLVAVCGAAHFDLLKQELINKGYDVQGVAFGRDVIDPKINLTKEEIKKFKADVRKSLKDTSQQNKRDNNCCVIF